MFIESARIRCWHADDAIVVADEVIAATLVTHPFCPEVNNDQKADRDDPSLIEPIEQGRDR